MTARATHARVAAASLPGQARVGDVNQNLLSSPSPGPEGLQAEKATAGLAVMRSGGVLSWTMASTDS